MMNDPQNNLVDEIAKLIAEYDFENGDVLVLKFGGDGDNGEHLKRCLHYALSETGVIKPRLLGVLSVEGTIDINYDEE